MRTLLSTLGFLLSLPLAHAQSGNTPIELPDTITPSAPGAAPNTTSIQTTTQKTLQTAFETYESWLRRYDNRFSELEERIARTSQELDTLEFEALGDVGVRADAVVSHYASTGAYFLLEEIRYQIDGVPIISRLDSSGALGQSERFDVFSGRIVPGRHILSVEMVFRVKGFDLLSSELRGARFRARSNFTFEAKDGTLSTIEVVGKDSSTDKPAGLSITQVEKRFKLTFTLKESTGQSSATPTPTPTPASTPSSAPK
jgi:hypothetical protein